MKSTISISNLYFYNNYNSNKLECGNLKLQNDISISVSNSNFTSNMCEGNGGAMYRNK